VRNLLRSAPAVLAVDEVGRGAAAGPCSVGVLFATPDLGKPPAGVADSKSLSPSRRSSLVAAIRSWAPVAVGHASSVEVDEFGISLALTLACRRAFTLLSPPPGTVVLLDGSYDWVNPSPSLLLPSVLAGAAVYPVSTLVRADATCAAVAAASIVAKVERDALMSSLAVEHPGYGWERNKGYLAPGHIEGIKLLGFSPHHRRSWSYAKVLG